MNQVLVRGTLVLALIGAAFAGAAWLAWSSGTPKLELDESSAYSHIRVRRTGNQRTLFFVRDNGHEVIESRIDLKAPHRLQLPYTRTMFASYLVTPDPKRVLILGLGGGSMVHFLKHHDPDLEIDVVEIDPTVVRIAEESFGIRSEGNVRIFTEDAFDYFDRCDQSYDVIYMDAFLKPSPDTNDAGVPLRMRTLAFYRRVQGCLNPGGVVTFNLTPHSGLETDVDTIEAAFPGTLQFECASAPNLVLVAPARGNTIEDEALLENALATDERFDTDFSFDGILSERRRASPPHESSPPPPKESPPQRKKPEPNRPGPFLFPCVIRTGQSQTPSRSTPIRSAPAVQLRNANPRLPPDQTLRGERKTRLFSTVLMPAETKTCLCFSEKDREKFPVVRENDGSSRIRGDSGPETLDQKHQ